MGLKDVCVLLVCGLPGSGKSTLRQKLVKRGWAYVSQDEMLTADACEKALIKALKSGQPCVVDRCNVTPSDRRLWMQHANRAVDKGLIKGVQIHFEAVWMATPPSVCKIRAQARTGHETLSPEKASEVIESFCRGLKPPERSGQEPYDAVHIVVNDGDIEVLLKRFADPMHIDSSHALQPPAKALTAAMAAAAAEVAEDADVQADGTADAQEDGLKKGTRSAQHGAEIFIMRHSERADRAKNRDDGWPDDPPLTKEGRELAKRAGAALGGLATLPWAPAIYCSPFYRCLQTANEVAAELGLPVRVEPGLSEICCQRIFEQAPRLRTPIDAVASAFQRIELDTSVAPVKTTIPQWPEPGRCANQRVLETAQNLAVRHPGQAVVLVCHAHSLVELTRNLPKSGGGSTGSHTGYCALTHVIPNGSVVRSADLQYLKSVEEAAAPTSCPEAMHPGLPVGEWEHGWHWKGLTEEQSDEFVVGLFEIGLDEALIRFPAFKRLFCKGTSANQNAWRQGWESRCPSVQQKLTLAHASGIFDC